MYLQEIFEVVLGLVFIWLILSTATMQLGEWVANALKWRARQLEKTIKQMLNDEELTRLFYDHPLIRSLSDSRPGQDVRPAYIPSSTFSTVLLSIIQEADSEGSLLLNGLYSIYRDLASMRSSSKRQQARLDLERLVELARLSISTESNGGAMRNLMVTALQKEIADLGGRYPELQSAAHAALEKAAAYKTQIDALVGPLPNAAMPGNDFNKVLQGMLALRVTNPGLRMSLSSLFIGIQESNGDCLDLLRKNIESWFNSSMDRLSGRYKRRAQLMAFGIGLVTAALLNIDTISISNQLWREPIMRQAIAASANQIVAQSSQAGAPTLPDLVTSLQNQFLGVSLPFGWTFAGGAALAGAPCSLSSAPGSTFGVAFIGGCIRPVDAPLSGNGSLWWLAKLIGLMMTGLATTQGSSFWFDILVKIVNVRGAGIKPT